MLSEYQKQLNRINFFSNKVITTGKVDFKFKLKPMSTLISKLKKQVEQNISKEIEQELTTDQIETRLRIFLPGEFKRLDLETTTYKTFYKILVDNNIVSRKDINDNKEFIKKIITEEVEKHNIQRDLKEKEEAKAILEKVKEEKVQEESKTKKTQLYRSENPVRNLITKILADKGYYKKDDEADDDEEDDDEQLRRISSKDLERLFKETNVNSTVDRVADEIYDLFEECKIPSKYYNLSLTSARFIANLLKEEKNIIVSEYIVQLFMGKYCRLYDLKNIMMKNKSRIEERCKSRNVEL